MSQATNSTWNSNSTVCYTPEDNPTFKVGLIVLYSLICMASLLGNTLVIATVYRNLQMHTAVNLFITNMAGSDILQAVFGTPRVVTEVICGRERWLFDGNIGIVTCKLAYFVQDTSLSVSILSLMCITIERFYAVVFPFKFSFLKRHSKIVIPGVWLTGASLHAIYFKIFTLYDDNKYYPICYQKWSSEETAMTYFLAVFVGLFFFALITTVVMYTIIIIKIKQKNASEDSSNGLRRSRDAQERKLLRVVLAITLMYFACFFPQTVLIIVAPMYAVPQCHAEALRLVTKVLEQTYSAANPILCITFSANYRAGFASTLACFSRRITWLCRSKSVDLSIGHKPTTESENAPENNHKEMREIKIRNLDFNNE